MFYPHGIGHLLGLQVHDVGGRQRDPAGGQIERPYNHPFLRLTRKLEDGFVVTVEPGFYFIDQLLNEAKQKPIGKMIEWKRVEQLKKFGGVRIEDDVVARPGGHENLTRPAFDELVRIDAIRSALEQHPRRQRRVQRAQQRQQAHGENHRPVHDGRGECAGNRDDGRADRRQRDRELRAPEQEHADDARPARRAPTPRGGAADR